MKIKILAENLAILHTLFKGEAAKSYSAVMYEKLVAKDTLVLTRNEYNQLLETDSYALKLNECPVYSEKKLYELIKEHFPDSPNTGGFDMLSNEGVYLTKNMYDHRILLKQSDETGTYYYYDGYAERH